MTDNRVSCFCDKHTIGIQVPGCCASAVCEDHTERNILSLASGETMKSGAFTFRYPVSNE